MTGPRAVPGPPAMTEKQLERIVKEAAATFSWERYHTHRSDFSPAGYPDETLVRGARMVIAELKSEKGKLSPAQELWRDLLGDVETVEYHLWRPSDIDNIVRILR